MPSVPEQAHVAKSFQVLGRVGLESEFPLAEGDDRERAVTLAHYFKGFFHVLIPEFTHSKVVGSQQASS